ncbi:alpha/beta-hydrolase [Ramicandelaber brevisporus]|nr:alpha/beta-hydrolase [Ramicandelaber brevisporus]
MRTNLFVLALAATSCSLTTARAPSSGLTPSKPPSSSALNEIKRHAAYSMAAYSDIQPGSFSCVACRDPLVAGTTVVKSFSNSIPSSHGFIATNSKLKTIVVSFRGTNDPVAFIQDAAFFPTAYPSNVSGSKVHSGFLAAYNSVAGIIRSTVKDLVKANPSYTVVFTGHSLGGAEAMIAAVDLTLVSKTIPSSTPVRFYGIGVPRVGNSQWAKLVNGARIDVVRTNNKADIVTRIPPSGGAFDYIHPDQEVWIRYGSGDIVACSKSSSSTPQEDPSCAKSVPALKLSIPDHLTYFGFESKPSK